MDQTVSSVSQTTLLSPLDEDILMTAGLASPVEPNGTRRLHRRRLNSFSEEEYQDIPLVNVSSTEAYTHKAFVEIPNELISEATLRYIGYTAQVASHLWHRWTHWPPGPPVRFEIDNDDNVLSISFIDFAMGYIDGRHVDAYEEDDQEWFHCLNACGISIRTQANIMDPIYRKVRLNETCTFWIKDTMDIRYHGLKDIQRTSRKREKVLMEARTRPAGSTSISTSGEEQGLPPSSISALTKISGGRHSISAIQRQEPDLEADTAMSIRALAAQNAPGYTTLYKGMAQSCTNSMDISLSFRV